MYVSAFGTVRRLSQTSFLTSSPLLPHSLLFQLEPGLLEEFPFYNDEWSRAHYKDFQGTHSEIPANGWNILCREVFHMKESQFVRFQFKVALETCRVRVVDNDTGKELPTVLHWVAPTVYQPNTVSEDNTLYCSTSVFLCMSTEYLICEMCTVHTPNVQYTTVFYMQYTVYYMPYKSVLS